MEEKKRFNFDWQVCLSVFIICVLIVSSVAIVFVAFDNDNVVALAYVGDTSSFEYAYYSWEDVYIYDYLPEDMTAGMYFTNPLYDDYWFGQMTSSSVRLQDRRKSVERFTPVKYVFDISYYGGNIQLSTFVLQYYDTFSGGETEVLTSSYAQEGYESFTNVVCYGSELMLYVDVVGLYPDEEIEFEITSVYVEGVLSKEVYINGYNHGYDVGLDEGYNNGYDVGFDEGRDDGYSLGFQDGATQGFNEGYETGYQSGYNYGLLEQGDFSWYGLVSSVFDAPLRILIGTWQKNAQGEYELVGGMLNFEMPGLNVNFAPVLTSLFTLVILIVILRFVFSAIL